MSITIKERVIKAFKSEFSFIASKFEIIDLLDNNSPMDYNTIEFLKLPSDDYNIVWHPGVYLFLGNDAVYRAGVSVNNSRNRVMQHLEAGTSDNGFCIWDIDQYADKSILLINAKEKTDRHWLLAIEAFLETEFEPHIKAKRIG
jgi:hypothetical protein